MRIEIAKNVIEHLKQFPFGYPASPDNDEWKLLEEPFSLTDQEGELFLKVPGIKQDDIKAMGALDPAQLLEMEMKIRMASTGTGGTARVTSHYPVTDGDVIPDFPNDGLLDELLRRF